MLLYDAQRMCSVLRSFLCFCFVFKISPSSAAIVPGLVEFFRTPVSMNSINSKNVFTEQPLLKSHFIVNLHSVACCFYLFQGLVQNQTRVTNINDSSVLPDLCASHQHQLDVMLQKHLQLQEICRMCRVAKDELCKNLHVRLRSVAFAPIPILSPQSFHVLTVLTE